MDTFEKLYKETEKETDGDMISNITINLALIEKVCEEIDKLKSENKILRDSINSGMK